jgi:hypothetical protein
MSRKTGGHVAAMEEAPLSAANILSDADADAAAAYPILMRCASGSDRVLIR